jgi:ADP-ribosylglycohydrolase
VGIRWAGHPETAAAIARRLAAITHAEVGIDGAAAFAAAIAVAVGGGGIEAAVRVARSRIGSATWLSRMLETADRILEEEGSLFAAVPAFNDDIANRSYSFGNVVAETLPLALLIAGGSSGLEEGLAVSTLVPKQADTLPAMVGALLGASLGAAAIPVSWTSRVEELTGVCVPSTRGVRLRDLAAALTSTSRGPHEPARARANQES